MTGLFLQLFWTFFLIGLFTFGGGYSVIGIIQSEVVTLKGWISESVFTDIVAISQMTPGPVGLNCSTYVGYEVMKSAGAGELVSTLGSLTASFAIVLPSFIIMLAIVKIYSRFCNMPTFRAVTDALKPAVAGLIGAAALALICSIRPGEGITLISENFPDWKSWVLFVAAFAAYCTKKAGPIIILASGALLGLIVY